MVSCMPLVVYLLIPTSNHNQAENNVLKGIVVYLLIPTSNHNCVINAVLLVWLYIFWFLHQTTTVVKRLRKVFMLYIFWFLHQTTTQLSTGTNHSCCISFDSYIKPQLRIRNTYTELVVYLLIPTSNHNNQILQLYLLNVVYLLIPTSNHNLCYIDKEYSTLYIFWFLHQTTTLIGLLSELIRCISFDSYIKPQR